MQPIKVRHKLTNELMTIKKINGDIVTCFIEKPYFIFGWIVIDTAIVHSDNLVYEVKDILK